MAGNRNSWSGWKMLEFCGCAEGVVTSALDLGCNGAGEISGLGSGPWGGWGFPGGGRGGFRPRRQHDKGGDARKEQEAQGPAGERGTDRERQRQTDRKGREGDRKRASGRWGWARRPSSASQETWTWSTRRSRVSERECCEEPCVRKGILTPVEGGGTEPAGRDTGGGWGSPHGERK